MLADGTIPKKDANGNTHIKDYLKAYFNLIPELKKQIPSDWKIHLM